MATGFGWAGRASTWFEVPVSACVWQQNPLTAVVSGHECLFLSSMRIFEVFLMQSWAHKGLRHFREELLSIASRSPPLLAAWEQGTASSRCSTVASALHRTSVKPRGATLAARCVSEMPALVPWQFSPTVCINAIYEGCLGQNGLCDRILQMFFQAL